MSSMECQTLRWRILTRVGNLLVNQNLNVGSTCKSVKGSAYLSTRYWKTLPVIFWRLELYRIQSKVEIIGFMSYILSLREWSIGLTNDKVQG